MRNTVLALMACAAFIVSGCVSIPAEYYLVGERSGIRTLRSGNACDTGMPSAYLPEVPGPVQTLDSGGFSLTIWNIHKGRHKGWEDDLRRLGDVSDLLVIQEAYLNNELSTVLHNGRYQWDLPAAFRLRDAEAGVLTASKIRPVFLCTFRSREPVTAVPKTILITRYPLSSSEQSLLVANVHLINFTIGTAAFAAQLQRLEDILSRHEGPLIVAGDFNTWRNGRMAIVERMARALELESLPFADNAVSTFFRHRVDHIYYRGLEAGGAIVYPVRTSDHNPILVTFRLSDGY